jgi:hypothetical protein
LTVPVQVKGTAPRVVSGGTDKQPRAQRGPLPTSKGSQGWGHSLPRRPQDICQPSRQRLCSTTGEDVSKERP